MFQCSSSWRSILLIKTNILAQQAKRRSEDQQCIDERYAPIQCKFSWYPFEQNPCSATWRGHQRSGYRTENLETCSRLACSVSLGCPARNEYTKVSLFCIASKTFYRITISLCSPASHIGTKTKKHLPYFMHSCNNGKHQNISLCWLRSSSRSSRIPQYEYGDPSFEQTCGHNPIVISHVSSIKHNKMYHLSNTIKAYGFRLAVYCCAGHRSPTVAHVWRGLENA